MNLADHGLLQFFQPTILFNLISDFAIIFILYMIHLMLLISLLKKIKTF
jgi:hypothetical protein